MDLQNNFLQWFIGILRVISRNSTAGRDMPKLVEWAATDNIFLAIASLALRPRPAHHLYFCYKVHDVCSTWLR